jgi:uncharacterized protein (TIGR03546 family)
LIPVDLYRAAFYSGPVNFTQDCVMLTLFARLLNALNSDSAPGQVAFAFSLSLFVGLMPFLSVFNLLILLLVLILRVNLSAFIFGVMLFSLIGYLIDPLSASLGEAVLLAPGLQETWTSLYQNEWMRVLAFNNTVTMGGFLIALVSLLPVTYLSRVLIIQYRHRVLAYINRLKVVQVLKASKVYALYRTFAE